jgi:hypothetical protein
MASARLFTKVGGRDYTVYRTATSGYFIRCRGIRVSVEADCVETGEPSKSRSGGPGCTTSPPRSPPPRSPPPRSPPPRSPPPRSPPILLYTKVGGRQYTVYRNAARGYYYKCKGVKIEIDARRASIGSPSKLRGGGPGCHITRAPTPRAPTPRVPTPRASTPRASTPRASTPRAPTPRASTPRAPTPRASTPRVPTPRVPTPRASTPRASTPRVPTPRAPTPRVPRPGPTAKDVVVVVEAAASASSASASAPAPEVVVVVGALNRIRDEVFKNSRLTDCCLHFVHVYSGFVFDWCDELVLILVDNVHPLSYYVNKKYAINPRVVGRMGLRGRIDPVDATMIDAIHALGLEVKK